jgi:outer membrane protein TolC
MRYWVGMAAAIGCLALGSGLAEAQNATYRAQIKREPAAQQVVKAALRHFKVHPDALDSLRTNARARAFLPILSGGYQFQGTDFARTTNQMITNPSNVAENTSTKLNGFTAGASWDLRELAFNPAEIQVYGLVGTQRDIILEVTRTYYLRRQLILRLALRPPQDELAKATLELRVDEYTTILDSLTGGWFSRSSGGKAGSED